MRTAAITGMLSNKDEGIKKMAESALNRLLLSKESKDKKNAIAILNEVKDEYDSPEHIQLLKDDDPEIRDLATKAIGKSSRNETLVALLEHIGTNEKQVLASLYNAGANAIPVLKEQITRTGMPDLLHDNLITLCGKIGGDRAIQVLLELLKEQPQHTSTIIKALHRCRFIADADTQKQLEAIAGIYIINGVELLHMQQGLSKKDPRYDILNSSLQDEIQEIREILLSLFGCIYDREKINQVKYGLNTKHKESIANAMEIIELTVKKEIGKQFNTLFENTSIEQRCIALRALFTEKKFGQVEHILERILSEKPVIYYNWTKACSMYISKKYDHLLDRGLYKKYVNSDNKLLKETALFAVSTP
jgi:ATP:ADP antiporter, AAA family